MFSFASFLDLPIVWFGLIATAVLLYVLLDGFDLRCGKDATHLEDERGGRFALVAREKFTFGQDEMDARRFDPLD